MFDGRLMDSGGLRVIAALTLATAAGCVKSESAGIDSGAAGSGSGGAAAGSGTGGAAGAGVAGTGGSMSNAGTGGGATGTGGGAAGTAGIAGAGSYHTQVVEYMIDDASKRATLTWQFPGSFAADAWYKQTWSTPIWGDANRLANGNVLVTAGLKAGPTRLFEVTRAGEVVWAMEWPANIGSYRGSRISPAPAEPIP